MAKALLEALANRLQASTDSANEQCSAAVKGVVDSAAVATSQISEKAAAIADALKQALAATQATEESKQKAALAEEEASRMQRDATAAAQAVKEQQSNANADAAATKEVQATAAAARTEIEALRGKVQDAVTAAQADQKATAKLAGEAATLEAEIKEYRKDLDDLISTGEKSRDELLERIESLLPHATSAGLSAAFEGRRQSLRQISVWVAAIFAASLVALTVLSWWLGKALLPQAGHDATSVTEWQVLLPVFLRRLIVAAPALWLAIFSAKQLKVLFRLEEEYAHKVVMSNSFEGYKREIKDLDPASIVKLTDNVLEAIRRSPVRFYATKHSSDNPLEMLAEHSGETADGIVKRILGMLTPGTSSSKKPPA